MYLLISGFTKDRRVAKRFCYFSESSQNCVIMPIPLVLNVNATLASFLSLDNAWLHCERWLLNPFDFHDTQSDDNLT